MNPGMVFDKGGVDYAGPIMVKSGCVCRTVITKAYMCIFVSFTVKAVHLEAVSELITATFIVCSCRFIAQRGKPTMIWSNHGTNFVGAARELKDLYTQLRNVQTEHAIDKFCADQGIQWSFVPEHAPHFGGLREAVVKSLKRHCQCIVGDVRLTFAKLATILAQVETCLNSRTLTPLPQPEDGIEVLTLGHFLIKQPLEVLPDLAETSKPISSLRRWYLCQVVRRNLVRIITVGHRSFIEQVV